MREDDEDAAGAQQARRGQGDEVAGAVTEAVRVHAGDDEIGALRSIVRANAYLAAKTLDDVPGVVEFRVWIHVG
ncbi:hypothetical protein GCM10010178_34860 [Lentzea flava]|uniref:Uncharacterized protein n=1 Tax=Lentzea flava TaxID=103732 RepID=A0ABQ2UKK5_9PSEU|nr:hypothetical protein GCM10010178_34860 [Lentzea flava]